MKIALGCDHGGYAMKEGIKKQREGLGHEVKDCGTYSTESCDYPIFGEAAARAVASGECEYGIVVCTTGIGISIAAELVQCRRRETDRRSGAAALVTEDVDLPLLRFLAEDPAPKALMTVYETAGSTPVKSGAMMAVDRAFRTAGTIGGGCSENAVLLDACRLIGTGEDRCVTVDMSNDVAEEEGMVCGGQMKVLIEDLGKEGRGDGMRT